MAETKTHQEIGEELSLFFFHEFSPGSPIFLPKGKIVYNKLVNYIREYYERNGYLEVGTPNVFDKRLWEISGHWQKYQENMFIINQEDDDSRFSLKPMNCPCHCLIFDKMTVSYNDLPVRLADFGALHRNELSGSLTGLTRVRKFHQDDAHIFCSMDQIEDELINFLTFLDEFYRSLGFEYELEISTEPEESIGSEENWKQAEEILKNVVKKITGEEAQINEGDGAFYGPKIDITLKDSLNRSHQCGTVQLDFNLPERFDLKYQTKNGHMERPVIIHRAVLGSLERFMAILLEHSQGRLPFRFSPRQIAILTISSEQEEYALEIANLVKGFNVGLYIDDDDIRAKVKKAEQLKFNYLIVLGNREKESGTISVRGLKGIKTVEELLAKVN